MEQYRTTAGDWLNDLYTMILEIRSDNILVVTKDQSWDVAELTFGAQRANECSIGEKHLNATIAAISHQDETCNESAFTQYPCVRDKTMPFCLFIYFLVQKIIINNIYWTQSYLIYLLSNMAFVLTTSDRIYSLIILEIPSPIMASFSIINSMITMILINIYHVRLWSPMITTIEWIDKTLNTHQLIVLLRYSAAQYFLHQLFWKSYYQITFKSYRN